MNKIAVEPTSELFPIEPFVDEYAVARFLRITPRRVVEMARQEELPSHPIGRKRKTWRFRMSEINEFFDLRKKKRAGGTINPAVPGTQERT